MKKIKNILILILGILSLKISAQGINTNNIIVSKLNIVEKKKELTGSDSSQNIFVKFSDVEDKKAIQKFLNSVSKKQNIVSLEFDGLFFKKPLNFNKIKTLKELHFINCDGPGLEQTLIDNKNKNYIKGLELNSVQISDYQNILKGYSGIKSLKIKHINFQDSLNLNFLNYFPNINSVYIENISVFYNKRDKIKALDSIKEFQIVDANLLNCPKEILKSNALNTLLLKGNPINLDEIVGQLKAKNLTTLNLDVKLSPEDVLKLKRNNPNLVYTYVNSNSPISLQEEELETDHHIYSSKSSRPEGVKPRFSNIDIPEYSEFIDPNIENSVILPSGSSLIIPAFSIAYENNTLVNGEVEIKYREYQNGIDYYFSGINMDYAENGDSFNFISYGMIDVKAFQGEKELKVANGKSISYNSNKIDNAVLPVYLYSLNKDNTWKKENPEPVNKVDSIVNTSHYVKKSNVDTLKIAFAHYFNNILIKINYYQNIYSSFLINIDSSNFDEVFLNRKNKSSICKSKFIDFNQRYSIIKLKKISKGNISFEFVDSETKNSLYIKGLEGIDFLVQNIDNLPKFRKRYFDSFVDFRIVFEPKLNLFTLKIKQKDSFWTLKLIPKYKNTNSVKTSLSVINKKWNSYKNFFNRYKANWNARLEKRKEMYQLRLATLKIQFYDFCISKKFINANYTTSEKLFEECLSKYKIYHDFLYKPQRIETISLKNNFNPSYLLSSLQNANYYEEQTISWSNILNTNYGINRRELRFFGTHNYDSQPGLRRLVGAMRLLVSPIEKLINLPYYAIQLTENIKRAEKTRKLNKKLLSEKLAPKYTYSGFSNNQKINERFYIYENQIIKSNTLDHSLKFDTTNVIPFYIVEIQESRFARLISSNDIKKFKPEIINEVNSEIYDLSKVSLIDIKSKLKFD